MMESPQPSVADFAAALQRTFDMQPEDARELGEVVLAQFESQAEVPDETLDSELRSVFYTLESKRLLSFRRVEYTREEGDRRRAFYWRLRPEEVETVTRKVPVEAGDDVYAQLPADAWRHAS